MTSASKTTKQSPSGGLGSRKPFICFDDTEHVAILAAVPARWICAHMAMIDVTDGDTRSVCGDTGRIKAICYDQDHAHDEFSGRVSAYPVDKGGQWVHGWAHLQWRKSIAG